MRQTLHSVLTQQAFPEILVLHFLSPNLPGLGSFPGPFGSVNMGPLANIGPLGTGPVVTGATGIPSAWPQGSPPTPLLLTASANSPGQGVLALILFCNPSWCLDFKQVTCSLQPFENLVSFDS